MPFHSALSSEAPGRPRSQQAPRLSSSRLASITRLSRTPLRNAISSSLNWRAARDHGGLVTFSIQAIWPPKVSKCRVGRQAISLAEVGAIAADQLGRRLAPVNVPGGRADHQGGGLDLRPIKVRHGDDAMRIKQIARRPSGDQGHQLARDDIADVEHGDSLRPIVSERRLERRRSARRPCATRP